MEAITILLAKNATMVYLMVFWRCTFKFCTKYLILQGSKANYNEAHNYVPQPYNFCYIILYVTNYKYIVSSAEFQHEGNEMIIQITIIFPVSIFWQSNLSWHKQKT